MQRFIHRILFAGLTALLLAPVAGVAQDQDKDQGQSSAAQTDNQSNGRQGRYAAMQRQRQHMAMLAEKLSLTEAQKAQFQ